MEKRYIIRNSGPYGKFILAKKGFVGVAFNENELVLFTLVNQRVNTQNKKAHRQGKLVGCYFDKCRDRYKAQVQIGKKAIYLGRYATEEEAHNIYVNACEHIEEYVDDDSFRELVNKDQK